MVGSSGDYEENSPDAVLRVALAVAFSDDLLDHEEAAKIEDVYRNILSRMDEYDEDIDLTEESEVVSSDAMDSLSALEDAADREELYAEWAECITDPDLQELALVAALKIAAEDTNIDPTESACMSAFCDNWGLDLDEVIAPFLDD
jgi:tellurite resistance protein